MDPIQKLVDAEYAHAVELLQNMDPSIRRFVKDKLWLALDHGHPLAGEKLIECYDNEIFPVEPDDVEGLNDLLWDYGILSGINLYGIDFVTCYTAKDRVMDPRFHFNRMVKKGDVNGTIGLAVMDYIDGKVFESYLVFKRHLETSKVAGLCYGLMFWNGDDHIKKDKRAAMEIWAELPHSLYMDVSDLLDDFNDISCWNVKDFLEALGFGLEYYGIREEE